MTAGGTDSFVLLTTLGDPAAAHLCAALLRSEGIPSRLQGESLGPDRLTVGEMAETQVWVPRSRLDDARHLVLETDVEEGLAPGTASDTGIANGDAGRWRNMAPALVALALLGLAAWRLLARLL
jgi:hypothetical protein